MQKQPGKTETGKQHAASTAFLDTDATARRIAIDHPERLLAAEPPLLIDEWHVIPELRNHIRRAVDERQVRGGYILTGSATPRADARRHSGAGRFSFLRIRPMSLFESGDASGDVSLRALFDGSETDAATTGHTVPDIAELLIRGGWPGLVSVQAADATVLHRDYLDRIAETDVPEIAEGFRDPLKVRAVLGFLGRTTATEVFTAELARDAGGAVTIS